MSFRLFFYGLLHANTAGVRPFFCTCMIPTVMPTSHVSASTSVMLSVGSAWVLRQGWSSGSMSGPLRFVP